MGEEKASFIRRHWFGIFVLVAVIGIVAFWQISIAKPTDYIAGAWTFFYNNILIQVHNGITGISMWLPYGVGGLITALSLVGFMRRSKIKQKASNTIHKTADKVKPTLPKVTPTVTPNPGAAIQETSDTAKEAISATKKSSEDLKKELEQVASA